MTDSEKLVEIIETYEKLDKLLEGFDGLVKRTERLKEQYDDQHSDAYHTVEALDLSASDLIQWAKATKEMSRERRQAKLTWELAQDLQKIMSSKGKPPKISKDMLDIKSKIDNKGKSIAKHASERGRAFMKKIKSVKKLGEKWTHNR